jgi:hypothetical protein
MKVQSGQSTKITKEDPKLSKDAIQAKIRAKFGKKADPKEIKPIIKDKVELAASGKIKGKLPQNSESSKAEITQERLKGILQAGAFGFNEKERRALGKILK